MYPKTKTENIISQEISDELIICNLEEDKVFCFNNTAKLVWNFCDGRNSIKEIVAELNKTTGGEFTAEIVKLAVQQFDKSSLLESNGIISNSISRRNLIKNIAASSIVALPIVSSLAMPPSAAAQASCNASTACACSSNTGKGNPCAVPGTNGCTGMFCACHANNNGNLNGTCRPL